MIRRFLKNERGSSTIEFVLWIPLFALMLMITSDASFVYLTSTRMENVARDAARRVSMGQISTDNIGSFVLSELTDGPYTVDASCSTSDYACVRIQRPVSSIVAFDVLAPLLDKSVRAETKMRLEPGVTL